MFCLLFPVYWLVRSSVTTQEELSRTPSYLLPLHPSLAAFRAALPAIAPALRNSAIIALGTAVVTLCVAVPTAYGLALARVGAVGVSVRLLVLVGLAFPTIMFVIPLYQLYYHLHLLNTLPGLMLADSLYSMPLGTLIVYTYMTTVPAAFSEAAQVEGASRAQILLRVVMPLSAPALATTSIFAFLAAWGDYLFAETFTNGGSALPASVAVYSLGGPAVMAGSLILAAPAILAVVFLQRFIRAGLSAGGLTG